MPVADFHRHRSGLFHCSISSPGISYKWTSNRCSAGMAPFLPLRSQYQSPNAFGVQPTEGAVLAQSCFRHGTRGHDDPTRDRRNRNHPADGTRDRDGHEYRRRSSDNRVTVILPHKKELIVGARGLADTTITRGAKATKLADLKVGEAAELTYLKAPDGLIARSIHVR